MEDSLKNNTVVGLSKNNIMYLWRIIFTYVIAYHHLFSAYDMWRGWYIGVDFFAIMSGFLLQEHIYTHKNEELLRYVSMRFRAWAPIVVVSALLTLFADNYIRGGGIMSCNKFTESIPEFFLLNAYGVFPCLNGRDWYIQELFVLSIPLYYLLKNHKDFTIYVLSPLITIIVYSCIIREFGYMEGYLPKKQSIVGIINWPLIRILAGLMLGFFLWPISQKFKTRYGAIISSILFFLVILLSGRYFGIKYGGSKYDLLYIIALAIAITFGFSTEVRLKFWTNSMLLYFSKLTLFIYLSHYSVRIILRYYYQSYSLSVGILYFIVTTFLSILLYFLMVQLNYKTIWGKIVKGSVSSQC